MKSFLIVTSMVLASVSMVSTAAHARTNWQGEVMFTAVTDPACASDGWRVGDHALATLLPANLDNNGAASYLAFHYGRRNAYSLKVDGALVKGASYSAVGITSAGSNFTFTGKLSLHTQSPTPANVTLSTKFITVTGQITNWAGMTGCTVTYEGSFVRRR